MKNLTLTLAAVALACFTTLSPALSKSVSFKVGDDKKRDVVSFTSDAPIELIEGHTSNVTGSITVDDSFDLEKQPIQAQFTVDLASIDTGIPLRNEHMRDNFLQTKQFPTAVFKLKSIAKPVTLKPGQKTRVICKGDFSLHGKTTTKEIPVDITWFTKCAATEAKMPGCDLLQISAEFPIDFKDYAIQRPEIVFQKLSDKVVVKVGVTAFRKV